MAILYLILKAFLWVGLLGTLLGFAVPRPDIFSEANQVQWSIFLGSASTLVLRPVVQVVVSVVKSAKALLTAAQAIPMTKEELDELKISTPLDFCTYMAAYQAVKLYHPFKDPTLYIIEDDDFAVSKNKLFREVFNRDPILPNSAHMQIAGVKSAGNVEVECANPYEYWALCVPFEAAEVINKPAESLTHEDILNALSPEFKESLGYKILKEGGVQF